MKKLLLLSSALLLAGCGTTQVGSRSEVAGDQSYSQSRVEGQRPWEAGLQDNRWRVKRDALLGGNPTHGQIVSRTTEPTAEGGAGQGSAVTTVTTGQGSAIAVVATSPAATAGLEILDQAEIDLRKEELVVGKREVSNGGVMIRTVVQSEEVSQPIELRREEYVIERIPAGSIRDQEARAGVAFQGREIYVPLMREEVVSGKRVLLTERVKVGKRTETDRQTVTMPVRTEDVQIVKNPDLSDPRFSSVPRRSTAIEAKQLTEPARPQPEATADALNLAREELTVGKRELDNGGVFLQKVIRTENASQPIELRREEYAIERTPLSGQIEGADFNQRQISLTLTREEPVTSTRNYIAETIKVHKQLQTDRQVVSGSVRKEAVEVVKLTDKSAAGQGGTGASNQSGVTVTTESNK